MKKGFRNIGFIIISMILTLQSCLDAIVPDPEPNEVENDLMVPIALDLHGIARTYGTDYSNIDPVPGSAMENTIKDIVVYIFDNTYSCEKILFGTSSPTDTVLVKAGIKHFIAVVNAEDNVYNALFPLPIANPSSVSYPVLRRTLSDALPALPSSPPGFLMVGEKLNFPVTDQRPYTNPNLISIDVKRKCAKVTMSFTKSALAIPHNITLQKVTLFHGANKVYLLDKPAVDDIAYTLSDFKNSFFPNGSVQNTPTYISLADSFYTYASDCGTDTTKAVRIEIEAAINSPFNIRTAKFFLASYDTGLDTVYDVRQNFWYDVKVNIQDPGMDSLYVTVKACPWNVADSQRVDLGIGGKYETALPFKLVKNYTIADIGLDPTIAAIETHSKGASWIDVTVTDGANWRLVLNDPSAAWNQNVMASLNNGATWSTTTPVLLTSTGTDNVQRVYIYRPYLENNEPTSGPDFHVELEEEGVFKYAQNFTVQPRDTVPIPTNSYVLRPQLTAPVNETRAYIPLAGVYRYWEDYLMANGDSIPVGTITYELLWKDQQYQDVVKNITIIHADKRDSAYLYAEAGVPGNAVIAVKVGGDIYWTFHLWVTEYNPYEAAGQKFHNTSIVKNVFMDRNLGALSNSDDPAGNARGLFYQFGRKDPFPSATSWNNAPPFKWYTAADVQITTLSTLTVPSAKVSLPTLPPLQAIPHSIENPMTFYTRSGGTAWGLSSENPYLWNSREGDQKTAFDPCPEGWRIPIQKQIGSESPWTAQYSDIYGLILDPSIVGNGMYSPFIGYYPFGGYIDNSSIVNTGLETYLWTSYSSGNTSTGLYIQYTPSPFGYNLSFVQNIEKSYGASVRCVVDKNYILKAENGGLFGTGIINLKDQLLP